MEFNVVSGKVNLTDPCYEADNTCNKCNVPAKNGTWFVDLEVLTDDQTYGWGNRVQSFEVYHQSVFMTKSNLKIVPIATGDNRNFAVDSGQFGVFDSSTYVGDSDENEREWYLNICNLTLSSEKAGVTEDRTGFASSTGYGDGQYNAEGAFINGELVYFKIVFIEDEQESEYDDEDEEDTEY